MGRSVSGNVLGASTRLLDNATLRQSRQENLRLSRTANILSTRLRATQNYSKAPESEALRHEAQNLYRKQKDRYIDRPLPPVRKKRFNLGPGRAAMESQWERFLERYLIDKLHLIVFRVWNHVVHCYDTYGSQKGRLLFRMTF